MTDQNNENTTGQQQGGEAQATSRPRRSRRATRPVMTPEGRTAAEPTAADAPATGAADAFQPSAGEDATLAGEAADDRAQASDAGEGPAPTEGAEGSQPSDAVGDADPSEEVGEAEAPDTAGEAEAAHAAGEAEAPDTPGEAESSDAVGEAEAPDTAGEAEASDAGDGSQASDAAGEPVQSDAPATKPTRKRRTRASAPTAPAGSVSDTLGDADGQADTEERAAEEPKARRSRRPKQAEQEAAEPAAHEGEGTSDATPAASEPAAEEPAEPTAEEPAEPAAEEPAGATDDASGAASEVQAPEEPARSAPQRRSRRAGAAAGAPAPRPELDVFAAFGVDKDAVEETASTSTTAAPIDIDVPEREATTRTAEADQPEDTDGAEETDQADDADGADDSPRLPATALLFQAPDASAGRRTRRAGAPAGPPASPSEDTQGRADGAEPEAEEQAEPGSQAPAQAGGQDDQGPPRRRRRRGGRGRRRSGGERAGDQRSDDQRSDDQNDQDDQEDSSDSDRSRGTAAADQGDEQADEGATQDSGEAAQNGDEPGVSRRRRRRRSRGSGSGSGPADDGARAARDEVTALKGSTRLEAKRQRRRDGRDSQRRRAIITEAEFLARRESVERTMVVRERDGRTQIAILEDDVLVEHYVARKTQTSMVGNVYLGRVQNVLPSMEAAFIDLGKGRNAVLYAGEVNWDAAGLEGQPRRIEQALSSGDTVLVQVTKDPIGHKGARLTAQITLAGRYLVLVPSGAMTGISRKLPDTERARLKRLLKEIVPDGQGVIVRTAAEGASEEELRRDVERLTKQWADIEAKTARKSTSVPTLLKGEPELATRVVRDVFNEDFSSLVVSGREAWTTISEYVGAVAPDLSDRLRHWTEDGDVFAAFRIDEQLAKGMDRKVWLPSGGSLVIDRTEAMTVVDVNTGKFTGTGGTLEETVTRNNLEAAEEIVRQLRLRDIGGIIVIDFIDMVLEANRDLVMRRLVECLGRDRTRHQVAEVTSLGLVQMTRKRVSQGLVEAFSETCEHCNGRGFIVHSEPVEPSSGRGGDSGDDGGRSSRRRGGRRGPQPEARTPNAEPEVDEAQRAAVRATLATIAAAAAHAHEPGQHPGPSAGPEVDAKVFEKHVLNALPPLPASEVTPAERLDRLAHQTDDPAEAEEIEAAAAEAISVDGALLDNGQDEPAPVRLVEGGYDELTPPEERA